MAINAFPIEAAGQIRLLRHGPSYKASGECGPSPLQVKTLGSENSKKSKEVSELQARILQEEQREQLSRWETLELKQRITELETSQDHARKEV